MEYLIIKADCAGELESRVRTKIKEGFEPIGGASVACYPGSVVILIQAIVRKPNAENQALTR